MKLYTSLPPGIWPAIKWWNEFELKLRQRKEREEAREREKAIAKERIARDQSAAGFDKRLPGKIEKFRRANAARIKP
jgi:hypothetical protein